MSSKIKEMLSTGCKRYISTNTRMAARKCSRSGQYSLGSSVAALAARQGSSAVGLYHVRGTCKNQEVPGIRLVEANCTLVHIYITCVPYSVEPC